MTEQEQISKSICDQQKNNNKPIQNKIDMIRFVCISKLRFIFWLAVLYTCTCTVHILHYRPYIQQ